MGKHRQGLRSGIYKITCTGNGRYYYGRTFDITKRMHQHLKELRKGKHSNPHVQNCWNKYGSDTFIFELVEEMPDGEALVALEQSYIDRHIELPECMNLNPSAVGCKTEWTPERRAARSKWARDTQAWRVMRTPAAAAKSALARAGQAHSPERVKRITEAQKGRPLTDAHRNALKESWEKRRQRGQEARPEKWKPVAQIDSDSGAVIATYANASQAAKNLGCTVTPIAKAARGERPTGVGFRWQYI